MRNYFTAFICLMGFLIISSLKATEMSPWLGNNFEFEGRGSFIYQDYSSFASNSNLKKFSQQSEFLQLSLSNVFFNMGAECELLLANTPMQNRDVDSFVLTGRYVFQDDVAGDPLSLTGGVSLIKAFWPSLRDVNAFHHGLGEAFLFLSFGKEKACELEWIRRYWGLLGMGFSERGSPWVRAQLEYATRWKTGHELSLFSDGLFGLGRKKLHICHFKGYGSIHHQSVDIGFRYRYLLEYVGDISLAYTYRVYAYNFPAKVHRLTCQFLYTFGL